MSCRGLSLVYGAFSMSVSCSWCDVCHYLFLCLWWTKSLSSLLSRFCCLWIQSFAYGVSRCGFPCLSYLAPVGRFLTSHFFGNSSSCFSISVHTSPPPLYRGESCCSLPWQTMGWLTLATWQEPESAIRKAFGHVWGNFAYWLIEVGRHTLSFYGLVFWSE